MIVPCERLYDLNLNLHICKGFPSVERAAPAWQAQNTQATQLPKPAVSLGAQRAELARKFGMFWGRRLDMWRNSLHHKEHLSSIAYGRSTENWPESISCFDHFFGENRKNFAFSLVERRLETNSEARPRRTLGLRGGSFLNRWLVKNANIFLLAVHW